MRRKMLKALSVVLGAMVSTAAQAQSPEDVACEYGVPPMEPEPLQIPEPEPVPLYGIEEPGPPPLMGQPVKGQVLQAVTGTPLQGVQVTLDDQVILTDADGRFVFTLPMVVDDEVVLEFEAKDIDGKDGGGKHKTAKAEVKLVDGALPQMIEEQGLVLELTKKK